MRNLIMLSDDSSSDSSSDRSLSPSPPSHTSSSTFANPIKIPPKSCLSPPSTTSSDFSLSPVTPPSSVSPQTVICAYPSWPAGDFLSAQPSCFSHLTGTKGSCPSLRISDEDLLGLEELDLCGDLRVPNETSPAAAEISWEATKQPPVVVRPTPHRPSVGGKKRRRTSAPFHRRSLKAMSPIPEALE
ncbi:MAG: hypothetical protein LQ348_005670 [Seirophora lacunosa]|nr:MAG: hypothetical protein LQ348_005670 [Seirophora lacunosa]